jgi:acyl-CoA thioester hydrolase
MAEFHFYYPIEVRYSDLDPQGHVNNAKYLTYFEQARANYLVHLGLFGKEHSFMDLGIIVADAHVMFRAPILWHMEVRVGVRVGMIGGRSMTMEYRMVDQASGKELATGSTALVTFDYRTQKTIPVPDEWREKISRFENGA